MGSIMGRFFIFKTARRCFGCRLNGFDPLGHPSNRFSQPVQLSSLLGNDSIKSIVVALLMSQGNLQLDNARLEIFLMGHAWFRRPG